VRAVLLLMCISGCAPRDARVATAGDLEVHGAFVFAPPTTSEAAGYFTVVNRGSTPDTLVGISSPIAASAMLHAQVPDGGMVRMEHVVAAPVMPGDSLVLAPGGTHVMFTSLEHLPQPGSSLVVRLKFSRAGVVTMMMPVRSYGDAP